MQVYFWPEAGGSSSVDPWFRSGNLDEFVRCQLRADETYSVAKRQFSDRNMDVIMNIQLLFPPNKRSSTLKSEVFGSSSSLPPLVSEGGGQVCESVGKLIYCRIILTASSPGRLLIFHSLVIYLPVLPPYRSGRVR